MNQERRNDVRRRQGRYAFVLGLIISALLHLLLVLLNPAMVTPSYGHARGTPPAPGATGAQFTVLSLSIRDDDDLIQVEATLRTLPSRTSQFGTPGASTVEPGTSGRGSGTEGDADATVAERLRYKALPFSTQMAPLRETENQRALRETRERVLRTGEELGPLPPNGVAGSGGGGGGIRIPFGFGPPPPAQTVPAPPLPDSILRQDSIRAAARAALRRDSLEAARDTTRLRNVKPRPRVVIPRVLPDTTKRER